ncbi:MAG: YybH family protein [Halobacteriota archaeon]
MDFDEVVEQYHQALAEFTKANAEPVKALWSQRDDASLAGGMGGVSRGSEQVTKNLEFAAAQFHEGQISFETLVKYTAEDFAYLVEVERYEAKLFGSKEMGVSIIRCTTIFRREDGVWKAVHRHGDPLPAVRAVINALPYSVVSIQKAL